MKLKDYGLALALMTIMSGANAHEMTPTYFDLGPSSVPNVDCVKLKLFNRRTDVNKYQFEAYDEEWVPVAYASYNREIELQMGEGADVELFFKRKDRDKVYYICSRSVLDGNTSISSLICSKVSDDRSAHITDIGKSK